MSRRLRITLTALAGSAALLLLPAAASATDCGIPGAADPTVPNTALDVQGDIAQAKAGGYLQIPFDVPPGTTAIRVRYSYDQPGGGCGGSPNTLDMGVYEPRDPGETVFGADESRGWSGSAVKNLAIAVNGFTDETTYNSNRKAYVSGYTTRAYRPGPIAAGTWAVELGIAYIDPSDPDIHYHVRVETSTDGSWSNAPYAPGGYSSAPASTQPGWYAGDLHVHGEQEPGNAPMSQTFARAFDPPPTGSGLDFVTIVDHNNNVAHDDLASYQAANPGKLIIPGTEMTTYEGHFNNQGKAPFVDFRTGSIYQPTGSPPFVTIPDSAIGQVRGKVPPSQAFAQIQSNGNWTQINHPSIFRTAPSACRGCAWSYSDADTDFSKVDAIEIQTGPAAVPVNAPSTFNPFTRDAIAYYEHALDSGAHIAAVGSSDDHQGGAATGPFDSPVGSATTMVYAGQLSEQGITDGVKGDHTYVKLFGPSGPAISLEADVPGELTAKHRRHGQRPLGDPDRDRERRRRDGTDGELVADPAQGRRHGRDRSLLRRRHHPRFRLLRRRPLRDRGRAQRPRRRLHRGLLEPDLAAGRPSHLQARQAEAEQGQGHGEAAGAGRWVRQPGADRQGCREAEGEPGWRRQLQARGEAEGQAEAQARQEGQGEGEAGRRVRPRRRPPGDAEAEGEAEAEARRQARVACSHPRRGGGTGIRGRLKIGCPRGH